MVDPCGGRRLAGRVVTVGRLSPVTVGSAASAGSGSCVGSSQLGYRVGFDVVLASVSLASVGAGCFGGSAGFGALAAFGAVPRTARREMRMIAAIKPSGSSAVKVIISPSASIENWLSCHPLHFAVGGSSRRPIELHSPRA